MTAVSRVDVMRQGIYGTPAIWSVVFVRGKFDVRSRNVKMAGTTAGTGVSDG